MNNTLRTLQYLSALAGLLALLSACSSGMTREECEAVDWRGIGYEDGVQGRSQTAIAARRQACARHGVTLDLAAYRDGWDAGVRQYCQSSNGYRQGRNGNTYNAVCPPELEPAFLEAYREGRELYDLQSEVQHLNQALDHKRQRLTQLESAIVDTSVRLVSPAVTVEQRVSMIDDLNRFQQEHSAIQQELPVLQEQLARAQAQLATVSAERKY